MKKFLRIVLVVFLLLIVAIIALPMIFKGRIQEEVINLANDNLTAELAFNDVSLSLISDFPNLTVDLEELSITGLDEFEGLKLVDAKQIIATVDVMSLFGDTIAVKEISLIDPKINVLVMADGSANYDIAKPSEDSENSEDVESAENGGFGLELTSYSIENGSISYVDHTLPMDIQVVDLDHEGSGNFSDVLFTLATNTTIEQLDLVYDGSRYINSAPIDLKADLEIDNAKSKYTFKENELKINELTLQADGYVAMPTDDIEMDIDFAAPGAEIIHLLSMVPADFAHDLAGVQAAGRMDLNGFIRGILSDTSMPGFGLNLSVADGSFNYPDMPQGVENIVIDAVIDATQGIDHDALTVDINQFYMEMANNPVDLKLHVANPYTDPLVDCDVKAKVNFESLSEVIPLEEGDELTGSINADVQLKGRMSAIEEERYNDFTAAGEMVFLDLTYSSDSLPYDMDIRSAYFNFSPQHIELSGFNAMVGKTDIKAEGLITNYLDYALRDSMLTGNFDVRSGMMDLNEFMSEETEELESESEGEGEGESEVGKIELPGNIDFELDLAFDNVLYDDIEISNGSGKMKLRDQVAYMSGVELDMLGGSVVLDGSYDSKPADALLNMDFGIQNFNIKETAEAFGTIEKLAPIAKSCLGSFSTNMHLDCALNAAMEPIEESINGGGGMQTASVYVEKFEPLNKVAGELGIDRLAKQTIDDVNISYRFENGRVFVDPFTIKLEGIPTEIEGSMSFSQELDYRMKMDVPADKLPGNLGSQASNLLQSINDKVGSNINVGTTIPVSMKITGTMDKPKVAGNYGDLIQEQKEEIKEQVIEAVEEAVEEQIDNAKEEAIAKAKEEADQLMADAQAQADQLLSDAKKTADELKAKAYEEAQKVEDSAKNPFEKAAKKLAADKLRQEADNVHAKAIVEAQKKADEILQKAQEQADAKIAAAEAQ
ncbi:AsmA family protein [Sanyastnella coralliicola]|uniref:AsmA family protein n=1 Tax=Sanyastnella coralliicola TaxID=3069118 RepID=UPI0027B9B72D|nr:AsmA-like C-terminal region-containing protein [Longitalea sp. SCSIO 12813]